MIYPVAVGKRGKDEWLHDVDARQRNIVFPDTAENEGRFWRNVISGKDSLTFGQWIGISLVWLCMIAVLTGFWPKGDESWWKKILDGYGILILLTAALGVFIVLGNRLAKRNGRKR